MIKVGAFNFWPDFNYDNHFFLHTMKRLYGNDVQVCNDPRSCDVAFIAENYVPDGIDNTKTKVVSFMPEPKQVDYDNEKIDVYLSFDPTNHMKKNIRLPLWFIYINFFDMQDQRNPIPVVYPKTLYHNKWFTKEKTKFCVAPYSSALPLRVAVHNSLNQYKPTQGFGLPHGNGDFNRNETFKYDFISDYKFCMAFENTNKIGYVTEKLLQAKTAGCIPIYWGTQYAAVDFNEDSFINSSMFNTIEELLEYVKYVDQNEKIYQRMHNAPLFSYDIESRLGELTADLGELINV